MITIDDATLNRLRCAKCNGYLTVTPIILQETGKSICGRCATKVPCEKNIRNEAYEKVLKYTKIPCQYKQYGCKELLAADNIIEHEQNCAYGLHSCPLAEEDNCTWTGHRNEIKDHFTKKHPDKICQYPCIVKPCIVENSHCSYLMTMCGFLFFIQVQMSLYQPNLCSDTPVKAPAFK